ncbi:MAG: DUF4124 domain-containing protein [Betaproteobacteria bacterium]
MDVRNALTCSLRARFACFVVVGMQLAFLPMPASAGPEQKPGDALLTDSIFAPTSFWYQPIPADAKLHANSAGFVADFLRQKKAFYGTVSINLASWASPVYVVGADVPTVLVNQWRCMKQFAKDMSLARQWLEVPIPAYAEPASGADAEMTIYQPSTDTMWEFWRARKTDGQWEACWGGRMRDVSKSDGRWPAIYGTTATGLPFLGGQITAEELRRGEIRHAIGIALVEAESMDDFSWPAKRSDGLNPKREPNRIPEGLRFRLDPSVNVDALRMRPAGKVIARAAQKYGFVVWDKAGAIGVRSQNPKSYTALGQPDPYPEVFGGAPAWAVMEGFPWEKLQFLPQDYGKP